MLETTETLLNGLINGDQRKWAVLYRDYAPWIEATLIRRYALSHADVDDVIAITLADLTKLMPTYEYDKPRKGAFHSLVLRIAANKAVDLLRQRERRERLIADYCNEPIVIPESDWRQELFAIALRRMFADPSILTNTKLAFKRWVVDGEDPETVARDLSLTTNALYQIRSRLKARLTEEIERLRSCDEQF